MTGTQRDTARKAQRQHRAPALAARPRPATTAPQLGGPGHAAVIAAAAAARLRCPIPAPGGRDPGEPSAVPPCVRRKAGAGRHLPSARERISDTVFCTAGIAAERGAAARPRCTCPRPRRPSERRGESRAPGCAQRRDCGAGGRGLAPPSARAAAPFRQSRRQRGSPAGPSGTY